METTNANVERYKENLVQRFSLEDRVALVTGGSSGIGRRMAYALASVGANVVLVARRRNLLEDAAQEIESKTGAAVHPIVADLLGSISFEDLAVSAANPFGPPDILVNAAGVNFREPWNEIKRENWDATIEINLSVPFFMARALAPGMYERGQGNIINIASLQTYRAFPDSAAYGASKGGLGQLTRAMAQAWSNGGIIVVNAVAPGYFPTELTAPVFRNEELCSHHARMTAIGRNGELSDLDGATIFLASRAASYITGQILGVDGGYTAK